MKHWDLSCLSLRHRGRIHCLPLLVPAKLGKHLLGKSNHRPICSSPPHCHPAPIRPRSCTSPEGASLLVRAGQGWGTGALGHWGQRPGPASPSSFTGSLCDLAKCSTSRSLSFLFCKMGQKISPSRIQGGNFCKKLSTQWYSGSAESLP